MLSNAAIVASLLSAVSAHQNFHQFWVNDVSPGYQVAIRMPPSNSPVTDVKSDDIACNVNGQNVPSGVSTAAASEGDKIKVQWDSSSHPGPIQHYLFGPVTNASLATGVGSWVKIDDFNSENGTWANAIMQAQDMTYEFNLPTGLASGDYLLRSEMLALHGSQTLGGAQFYIGCAQLTITGTGSGTDACGPAVQLPGAYSETDPGIYIPNVYNGFDISNYTAPGGPVATCGAGSGTPATTAASVPASTSAEIIATSSALGVATSVAETPSSSSLLEAVATTPEASLPIFTPAPTTLQTLVSSKKSACKAKTSSINLSFNATSTRKSACKAKTTGAASVTSLDLGAVTTPVSSKKSACKAKTSAIVTNTAGLNNAAFDPSATFSGAAAAATSGSSAVTDAPASGTTLDKLLGWISSFYSKNAGTEYTADTTV